MVSESSLVCPSCHKSFGRLEHLKRHIASHDRDRHFECSVCDKPFARKDTLRRHKLTHSNTESLVHSKRRACVACVVAKARCSGDLPCDRCQGRDIDCQFPTQSNVMRRPSTNTAPAPDIDQTDLASGHRPLYSGHDGTNQEFASPGLEREKHQPSAAHHAAGFVPVIQDGRSQTVAAVDTPGNGRFAPYPNMGLSDGFQGTSTFDPAYWTTNPASNINWISGDVTNLDFAERHDLYPFLSSMHTFSPDTTYNISAQQDGSTTDLYTQTPNSVALTRHAGGMSGAPVSPLAVSESSQNSASLSATSSLPATAAVSGEYYVDGSGARLPRIKRRRFASGVPRHSTMERGFSLKCTPAVLAACSRDDPEHISDDQYRKVQSHHRALCLKGSYFTTFTSNDLAPKNVISTLVDNYLEHFLPVLPFLHRPTFSGPRRHFALLLAMAALGSHFVDVEGIEMLRKSLNEFVRRLLTSVEEEHDMVPPDHVSLAQMQLLHVIALRQSGCPRFQASASKVFRTCAAHCEHWDTTYPISKEDGSDRAWHLWLDREEALRTKFCIWSLDAVICSYAERGVLLKLDTIAGDGLPCHETIWATTSSSAWHDQHLVHPPTPTLQAALRNLYVEKRLVSDLGEFARILLIQALFHRTWEVQAYLQQGLSHFEPSAQKQCSDTILRRLPVWHPDMSVFTKWRNSACDCLDILHWSANATIGAASGMEHPTVLHLHFARVVLLSPLEQIIRVCKHLANVSIYASHPPLAQSNPDQIDADKKLVQQWVIHDQYKARLAAVHAGVSFWHVRKYSANAFHEPEIIALSTLMLWAISAFSPQHQHHQRPNLSQTPHDSFPRGIDQTPSSDVCDIILLDRPTDDELVQQFVREGNAMHANMTGVGDLFATSGPQRVLREGRKLLESLSVWRDTTIPWLDILQRLESVTAKASANMSTGVSVT